jgi:hypothetical protein
LKNHTGLRNGQIVIFGENQMVVGITHGKVDPPQQDDIARQASSRSEMIVMKFIEGTKKGE